MMFLLSPTALLGSERVESIELVRNELYRADDGSLRPRPTGETLRIPVGLVFRSIGYKGVALEGVPFDERAGIIPNDHGRVVNPADKSVQVGEYVVGWIKRGPSGIIGTNKPDALETVNLMLADAAAGTTLSPAQPRDGLEALLRGRGVQVVTFADWLRLDQMEVERGQAANRPRLKFSRIEDMLAALREALPE
jgi:ferredoxin--NADP+ reductase